MNVYSDISPRTTAYADRRLLTRAGLNCILHMFGQSRPVPSNKGQVISFRRYNKIDSTPFILQEGVTPTGKTLTKTDVIATLKQYGDWMGITDVIKDTHEDPVLKEMTDILGMQAGEMWDKIYYGILKAGTNVVYNNGTQRTDVNTMIARDAIRVAIRTLKRQEAKPIKSLITAGPNIGTSPIPPAFVALCHSDLQPDFEALSDWVPIQKYPSQSGLIPGEAGSVGELRVAFDNVMTAFADGGGAKSNGTYPCLSTSGTYADVYPILIFGQDAYGTVPLAGKESVATYVNNPKAINGDELAQRGSVGWKGWTTAVILQDLWMLRLEVAAKSY
jgi:N4-gp56 family major capsid protein